MTAETDPDRITNCQIWENLWMFGLHTVHNAQSWRWTAYRLIKAIWKEGAKNQRLAWPSFDNQTNMKRERTRVDELACVESPQCRCRPISRFGEEANLWSTRKVVKKKRRTENLTLYPMRGNLAERKKIVLYGNFGIWKNNFSTFMSNCEFAWLSPQWMCLFYLNQAKFVWKKHER